jgi:Asp-tRNA(Asn)/Glu-tRNA(Gln) amidotransferase A subunit family amidase
MYRITLTRRGFVTVSALGALSLAAGSGTGFAQSAVSHSTGLEWLPAWRLRELMLNKSISPVEVTKHFLHRIQSLDPGIGAFVVVDEEGALRAARMAERVLMQGEPVGELHGVPVSLKQMVAVAGLPLETGEIAVRDAIATERIRKAGGIIIGTTTLAGPAAMLGEAQVGASNPWRRERVAGASSSGSAASVAAGMCPVSIGSDGGGSTRLPAAWCGVLGMHPTVGRVPADQDIQRAITRTSWSASYGPMARDARDVATMLQVIAGPDWRSIPSFNGFPPDYVTDLDTGVRGMRMAWTQNFGNAAVQFDENSATVFREVRASAWTFTELGATVREIEVTLANWYPIFVRIAAQLAAGRLYPAIGGAARAWESALDRTPEPQWHGELQEALDVRQQMADTLLQVFEHYDILMCATSPRIAPLRDEYADWLTSETHAEEYTCLTGAMNLLGFPAISIPASFVDGMPVGLQLIARPDNDALLLRAAQAFMRARPAISFPGQA